MIGGGDFALNRIVPDIVRAWSADETLVLRRPLAVRPWQHVIEPSSGTCSTPRTWRTAATSRAASTSAPTRRRPCPCRDLVEHAAGQWAALRGGGTAARGGRPGPAMAETHDLTLDASQAQQGLTGNVWGWQEAIERTLQWYVRAADGERARRAGQGADRDYVERVGAPG